MFLKRVQLLLPWRRRAAERDMQEELRSVAAMAGARELGNLTLAAEQARDEWGWTRLEQLGRDARLAVRVLLKRPGFTVTAILSLALGIGANTALFTLMNAVSWRMLPIHEPERLLLLSQRQPGGERTGVSYQQYRLIRDHNGALDMAAYSPVRLNVSVDGRVEPPSGAQIVSGSYFPLLGVRAEAGRLLGPDDDRAPRAHPVAVISHGYWKRRWALDPAVIGRQIAISGHPFTIVGVTPPEFFGVEVGSAPDLFVPIMMQPLVMPVAEDLLDQPTNQVGWLQSVARLKPGVTAAQASAMLSRLSASEETDWRLTNKFGAGKVNATLVVSPVATGVADLRSQFSQPLRILLAVVAVVLLIACANVGSLMLARAASRRSEFALRLALGAGRSRLVRQVLLEGLALALAAGAAGILLAYWGTHVLVGYVSAGRETVSLNLAPDLRVLSFTLGVSVLAALVFALVPALRATRVDPTSAGRNDLGTRHVSGSRQPGRAFVVVQVALSLVLLIGAGVFARSLQNLMGRQHDVDASRVLIVRVEPRGSDQRGLPGAIDRLDAVYRDLLDRVHRIPGVASATLARTAPLAPVGFTTGIVPASGEPRNITTLMIYPRYFETIGLPLVAGRDFTDGDLMPGAPLATIVNEAFVRQVLETSDPLGVRHGAVMLEPGRPPVRLPMNIVGVVKDSPYPNLREQAEPMMYSTFRQTRTGRGQMVLYVRASGDTSGVIGHVRAAVQTIDPNLPTFDVHTLREEVDATLVRERLIATLSGSFALFALGLVCIGLYGLISFAVSRRIPEFGVRVALGAARGSVTWMVVRQTLALAAIGTAIGLPVAWVLGRLASRQLEGIVFQLTPTDPATIASAVVVLALAAAAAGWMPARRAGRVDPIVALRAE